MKKMVKKKLLFTGQMKHKKNKKVVNKPLWMDPLFG